MRHRYYSLYVTSQHATMQTVVVHHPYIQKDVTKVSRVSTP